MTHEESYEGTIFPQEDCMTWAKRYELDKSLRPHLCSNKCGKVLWPTVPYAHGDWRGLISKPHDCGPEYDLTIATKATPEGRQEIKDYFNLVANHLK